MANDNKESLLKTPMNQLGLSSKFGSLFEGGGEVLTLQQFFSRNKSLFYVKYKGPRRVEYFHCFPLGSPFEHERFKKVSRSFVNLYKFLRGNGFNHKDWIFLLPKTERGEFDYRELPKEMLSTFPLVQIVDVQVAGIGGWSPFRKITESLLGEEVNPNDIIVGDFISLEKLKTLRKDPKFRATLQQIQGKLRSYGFNQRNGSFMGIRFKIKKK